MNINTPLQEKDKELFHYLNQENQRQLFTLEMIASENYTSKAVMEAAGSLLTNKYAEGYPGRRYYGGCHFVDEIEDLARKRAQTLFECDHVNVQPHSGSQANMAAYLALAPPGSKLMGMDLSCGGHLTHGASVNFSGILYKSVSYGVNGENHLLDYDEILKIAQREKPQILITGHSAYPRHLDFKRFKQIADEVGAFLVVDMAHFSGLVAAGFHPSPVAYADCVTSTTHKTLRGPRGGFILCLKKWAKKIDSKIFPGIQGGPLEHIIAGKAVAFKEAQSLDFKKYAQQVLLNAQTLAKSLKEQGLFPTTGGTDNHLILIDLTQSQKPFRDITGKQAQEALDEAGIATNKNTVPGEKRSAFVTSGVRLGTPALTTRGMKENEMKLIAQLIVQTLFNISNDKNKKEVAQKVKTLCEEFPVYS